MSEPETIPQALKPGSLAEKIALLLDRVAPGTTRWGRFRRTVSLTCLVLPIAIGIAVASRLFQVEVLGRDPIHLSVLVVDATVSCTLAAFFLIYYCVNLVASVRQTRAELTDALRQAKRANEAKTAVIANVSHEIRTPLNGILGMSQVLLTRPLNSEDRALVETLDDSGKTLLTILNDILDLSKIEAGKLAISPVEADLGQLLSRIDALFRPLADEKHLDLIFEHQGLPTALVFDPVRVSQCVSNLVSNAIKFTDTGKVIVRTNAAAPGLDGGVRIEIAVIDTGSGIDGETQARLFTPFTQGTGSPLRHMGGTGLGLSITRQLAELMGGGVSLKSEVGDGSVFTLSFIADTADAEKRLSAPKAERIPPEAIDALRGARILVVDDVQVNRQVVRHFLAPHGADLIEAANGREALDMLKAHPVDLLVLDVHMPVLDGIETVTRMRASPSGLSVLPVVALTADAGREDRARLLAVGMTAVLTKPLNAKELVGTVGQCLVAATCPDFTTQAALDLA